MQCKVCKAVKSICLNLLIFAMLCQQGNDCGDPIELRNVFMHLRIFEKEMFEQQFKQSDFAHSVSS